MLMMLTSTHEPATDLGYLLHKNPGRVQTFDVSFGKVHVCYPERTAQRCTVALLLDADPVGLVRGKGGSDEGGWIQQYVNDRPYVASSLLSVALGRVFKSALAGVCKDRPDLVRTDLPLKVRLPVLPCRGGKGLLRGVFEPLGYEVK